MSWNMVEREPAIMNTEEIYNLPNYKTIMVGKLKQMLFKYVIPGFAQRCVGTDIVPATDHSTVLVHFFFKICFIKNCLALIKCGVVC